MMTRIVLTIILVLLIPLVAQATTDPPLTDPAQEARAVTLGDELRCTVCQSESINASQADMARDLRRMVRDKITAGWSDPQIIDYARTRYGDFILLKPPFQPNTYLLWLSPLVFVSIAGLCVFVLFRRSLKRGKRT